MTRSSPPPSRAGRGRAALAASLAGLALTTVALVGVAGAPYKSGPVAHGILPRTASSRESIAEQKWRAAMVATTTSTTPPLAEPAVAAQSVTDTTLQTPEDVPDSGATRPIAVIGRILIPKIGLDAELRDQITQESIDLGPSHWPGTALPGGFGNMVIAGHRNSHTAPFHDTGNLTAGDAITLVDAAGRAFTYTVTEMFVVDPSAMWITEQTPGHTLTLFTCHPLGSSAQRLVIRATLS